MRTPDTFPPVGQCCELDEPYQSPVATYDQPFAYVFDADDLTDGENQRNLNVITYSGADFLLRRVAGHDRCATEAQFRDVMARKFFLSQFQTAGFGEFVVLPEAMFPAATGITFDLFDVQRAQNSSGAYLSQIVFQGARRFKGYKRPPSYPYWEDEWSYTEDIAVDWGIGETRRFARDIYNFDFELLRITETIINPVGGGPPCAPGGANQAFKVQLFDQVYERVFSKPVIDDLIMDNSTNYQGIVPVPGIVYRIGQQIRFELTSLVTPGDCAVQVQLRFHGVRRRPC